MPKAVDTPSKHSSSSRVRSKDSFGVYEPQKYEDFISSISVSEKSPPQERNSSVVIENSDINDTGNSHDALKKLRLGDKDSLLDRITKDLQLIPKEINEDVQDESIADVKEVVDAVSDDLEKSEEVQVPSPKDISVKYSEKELSNKHSVEEVSSISLDKPVSSAISDIVLPEDLRLSNLIKIGNTLASVSSLSVSDKKDQEENGKQSNAGSNTPSVEQSLNTETSDGVKQINLPQPNIGVKSKGYNIETESEIESVVDTYKSDFEKVKSSSMTLKDKLTSTGDTSIDELSFSENNGSNFNFSTVGMVSNLTIKLTLCLN